MLKIISLISLLLVVAMLRKMVSVLPSVLSCAARWRECINMESSVKMRTKRDLTAGLLLVPFCLVISRYELISYSFIQNPTHEVLFGITLATFFTYFLFRILTTHLFISRKNRKNAYAAIRSERTFFIIMALCTLAISWIMELCGCNPDVIGNTIIWISAATYSLFLIRKYQIFNSYCSVFSGFLYLCALEIIPTGTLLVTVIIF